jgi:hypothetical protein
MHGVDQQCELWPADVCLGRERGGQAADGQAGYRLDDGMDAALRGEFRQESKLVEGAAKIWIEAHDIDPGDAHFGQRVEIFWPRIVLDAGPHQEAVTERYLYAAMTRGGQQVAPERGVVPQREWRIAEGQEFPSAHHGRHVATPQVRREFDEFDRRQAECIEKAETQLVHSDSGEKPRGAPQVHGGFAIR